MEILLIPGPVVKYEIIKSSKDMVNATRAPLNIPGIIWGTITLTIAWKGVHPKSKAASIVFSSKLLNLGVTDKNT